MSVSNILVTLLSFRARNDDMTGKHRGRAVLPVRVAVPAANLGRNKVREGLLRPGGRRALRR